MLFPNAKYLTSTIKVLGMIPIATGLLALLGVHDPIYHLPAKPDLVVLDSNLRFFGGVWFVLGLAIFASLKNISQPNPLFQWILAACVLGGVGRLASMILFAVPPLPFIAFTVLEIVVLPYLMLWQKNVAASVHLRYQE